MVHKKIALLLDARFGSATAELALQDPILFFGAVPGAQARALLALAKPPGSHRCVSAHSTRMCLATGRGRQHTAGL